MENKITEIKKLILPLVSLILVIQRLHLGWEQNWHIGNQFESRELFKPLPNRRGQRQWSLWWPLMGNASTPPHWSIFTTFIILLLNLFPFLLYLGISPEFPLVGLACRKMSELNHEHFYQSLFHITTFSKSTGRRSPKSVPIVCFFLNPELVSEPKHQSTSKPFHTLQACVGAGVSGSHKTNLSQGKMNSKVNEFVQTYSTHSVYISSSLQICQHFTGKYSEWIHGKVTTSDIILTIIPIFL